MAASSTEGPTAAVDTAVAAPPRPEAETVERAHTEPLRAPPITWFPQRQGWDRWLPAVSTVAVIVTVMVVTLWQLHPSLLLSDTTTTGGDTGAHYMMPAFFSSNLFPHLTGWSPAWYDGYPIYTFYFVLPDVLVALVSHLISYNVAFKLATVLGSLLLPVAAWALGRLFGLRPPAPAALAAAMLPFLFDYTWTIYGGNLFSTLAGEYAYSLSVALALLFLGLFARGIRTGRHRGWAAVVLAGCVVAHIVPAMFALVGAVLLTGVELLPEKWRLHDDLRRPSSAVSRPPGREGVRGRWTSVWWGASTVGLGLLLSGWWLVPFGIRQPYSTTMNYANVTTYAALLFPKADLWVLCLAGVAMVVGLALRSRFVLLFGALGGLSALVLCTDPFSSLYNVRVLPLWFLSVYLLAGWVFAVVVAGVARWLRRERMTNWALSVRAHEAAAEPIVGGVLLGDPRPVRRRPRPKAARWAPAAVVGPLLCLVAVVLVVVPPFIAPIAKQLPQIGITPGANEVTNWADWNYSGYESKVGYAEYKAINATMASVGRRYGCGRALWEYNANENRFGTPEALMLLPYWTGGCIDSQEGLLFESSATTPYHFINQAELSVAPSEAVVGLPYGTVDVPLGIQHLQLLGVRYFMAFSPQVQQAAAADPTLKKVASTGPWPVDYSGQQLSTTWDIYRVAHSAAVTPLTHEPAVLTGVGQDQDSWLGALGPQGQPVAGPAVTWYDNPSRWDVELTAGGPPNWPRVTASTALHPPKVAVRPTTVTRIRQSADSISFHVSRVGTPVLVKVSYFPNWRATGAEGPWRATPNLMVVVPTSHDVTLTYGTTNANFLGDGCTLVGVAILVVLVLAWRRRRRSAPSTRSLTLSSHHDQALHISGEQARYTERRDAGGVDGQGEEVP